MSVLASKRKESRFEPVVFSLEIHDMLVELMQRQFGVKDLDQFVRMRYAFGKDKIENFSYYRFLMQNFKVRIDHLASKLTNDVFSANSIYPKTMTEYEKRRSHQTNAIVDCELLIKELQRVVTIFEVDINGCESYIHAIDREIGLIKKWRQSDNKIKAYVG